jgi:hypothetical protein
MLARRSSGRTAAAYSAGRGGALQRLRRGDLRADVHVHADEAQPGQPLPLAIDREGVLQRDAELVRLQAGGDVRMAPGVDVGIDAQRHARLPLQPARDGGDAIELARRLGVDGADAVRDRVFELGPGLADAGEDDIGGSETGAERHLDLARRIGVGAAAERAEQAHDRQRRVGFQRVMDCVRIAVEGRVDRRVRLGDGSRAVDVDRGADAIDDGGKADAVAGEAVLRRLER